MDTQLCLYISPEDTGYDAEKMAENLADALETGKVSCVILCTHNTSDSDKARHIDMLRPVAHNRDIAFVLQDTPAMALQTGCDGVHLDYSHIDADDRQAVKAMTTEIKNAVGLFGKDAIVGVATGKTRHLAMTAGESGASYVCFSDIANSRELAEWWCEVFTVPCVCCCAFDMESIEKIAATEADFIMLADGVWSHKHGPATAIKMAARKL